MAQRKCPHCSTWNEGEQKTCISCDGLLDKNEVLWEERKRKGVLVSPKEHGELFEIKPHYPWIYKVILHIIRPIFWVFMGIISFVAWLIAWIVA
jgi:hypothetical protein